MWTTFAARILGGLLIALPASAAPLKDSSCTVQFEVTLTWEPIAPDGYTRNVILMNGQFPGPTLYLNQGDDVEFLVHNELPGNTTVHFHGVEQVSTPYSDGSPGISQRGILPGESFLYRWNANQYGTFWYHGHDKSQISDGLYGVIVVKPSPGEPTAFGMISNDTSEIQAMRAAEDNPVPVFVHDWSHRTSEEIIKIMFESGVDDFCMDSVIVNGKGSTVCLSQDEINQFTSPPMKEILNGTTLTPKACVPATNPIMQGPYEIDFSKLPADIFDICQPSTGPMEVIEVDPADGWVSINWISAASVNDLLVSIDEHSMWVYAEDGQHIEPVPVDVINMPNGNRVSVLVKLDKPVGDYTIRVATTGLNQILSGYAMLSYKGSTHNNAASSPSIDYAGVNVTEDVVFHNDMASVPFPSRAPAQTADATFFVEILRFDNSWKWSLSGKESFDMSLETETPLLFDPDSWMAMNPNLTIATKMGQWVDIVISVSGPINPPHSVHKHSSRFYIIGAGQGNWNWSSVAEAVEEVPQSFNFENPPYRDGYFTLPFVDQKTWSVIRYQVTNPGAWLLHCHIQTHLVPGGMALAIIDGYDALPPIPQEYLEGNGLR